MKIEQLSRMDSLLCKGKQMKQLLVIMVVVMSVWMTMPKEVEYHYRHIAPQQLKAPSQSEIRDFYDNYKICQICIEDELSDNGITVEEFAQRVEFSIVLEHPKAEQFGVSLLFSTKVDYDKLNEVFDLVRKDFLQQFKSASLLAQHSLKSH